MGEYQGGTEGASPSSGDTGLGRRSGVRPSVSAALDTDLDAYLDRELFARQVEPEAVLVSEPEAPGPVTASTPLAGSAPCSEPEAPRHAPSVLALAAEEEEWLSQQPPPAAPPEEEPEPLPIALPVQVAVQPPVVQPVPTWGVPPAPFAPAPLPPQAQPWGAQPVAPASVRSDKSLLVGALIGVAAVGVFVAGALLAFHLRSERQAVSAGVVAPAEPIPSAVAPALQAPQPQAQSVAAPLVTGSAPSTSPVAPAPSASVASAPATDTPREQGARVPAPVDSAVAQVEPAVAESEPSAPQPRVAKVSTGRQEVLPASAIASRKKRGVSVDDEAEEKASSRGSSESSAASRSDEDTAHGEVAPQKQDGYAELDEKYARELGFTGKPADSRPDPKSSRTVWIPPAPGDALPEHLASSEVMRVVLSHKAEITTCIQQHKVSAPSAEGGRFVARWSVLTDGSTESAQVETEQFRGTPLAKCIEDLVRTWKFPAHRVQATEPIRFPFAF